LKKRLKKIGVSWPTGKILRHGKAKKEGSVYQKEKDTPKYPARRSVVE
jgi:hypothetical protein